MPPGKVRIYPSELHEYAYCPRYYFFHVHLGRRLTLRERLRMLLGRLFHWVKGVPDKLKGRHVEEAIEVEVGSGIVLRGRPDSFEIGSDSVLVIERKSGRGPRKGVWISDSTQASAYAFMLARLLDARDVKIRVEYASKARNSSLDEEKVYRLLKIIDEIILVREYGIVPYAKRSPRRCAKCPFREVCERLDRETGDLEVYEPGSWLANIDIDSSFK